MPRAGGRGRARAGGRRCGPRRLGWRPRAAPRASGDAVLFPSRHSGVGDSEALPGGKGATGRPRWAMPPRGEGAAAPTLGAW